MQLWTRHPIWNPDFLQSMANSRTGKTFSNTLDCRLKLVISVLAFKRFREIVNFLTCHLCTVILKVTGCLACTNVSLRKCISGPLCLCSHAKVHSWESESFEAWRNYTYWKPASRTTRGKFVDQCLGYCGAWCTRPYAKVQPVHSYWTRAPAKSIFSCILQWPQMTQLFQIFRSSLGFLLVVRVQFNLGNTRR